MYSRQILCGVFGVGLVRQGRLFIGLLCDQCCVCLVQCCWMDVGRFLFKWVWLCLICVQMKLVLILLCNGVLLLFLIISVMLWWCVVVIRVGLCVFVLCIFRVCCNGMFLSCFGSCVISVFNVLVLVGWCGLNCYSSGLSWLLSVSVVCRNGVVVFMVLDRLWCCIRQCGVFIEKWKFFGVCVVYCVYWVVVGVWQKVLLILMQCRVWLVWVSFLCCGSFIGQNMLLCYLGNIQLLILQWIVIWLVVVIGCGFCVRGCSC